LKGLGVNVKQAWSKVFQKSNSPMASVKTVYKKVAEAVEGLIGALRTQENKAIKVALADRQRVNRCFDLLGLIYPDWPSVEFKDVEGSKKRKRAEAGGKLTSTSKQGERGRGHVGGSKVDRVAVARVVASSTASPVVAAKPESTVSLEARSSVVGGLYMATKCQAFLSYLFCR
jgi:hypothetical protein